MLGKRLGGRYQIIERVGGGGMAVVYKANDTALGRHVAVKVMNESLSHDEAFIRRFHREARAAGSLSHPNVVNVYDAGSEGHTYYMVMEYIEGPTLMELIRDRGRIPPGEAVAIASQICDGLAHAHENGIVHRDIKPHNIMSTPGGHFKLTDFGISRSTRSSTITKTGYVMGSVHYFSPEQARGEGAGYPSDLYSLGVVLFEMVTGRLPFDGEEAVAIALKHLQEPVPDPRTFSPDVPEELCRILSRAMEKMPEKRFGSARELGNALRNLHAAPTGNRETNRRPTRNYGEGKLSDPATEAKRHFGTTGSRSNRMTASRRNVHRRNRQKKWLILTSAVAAALLMLMGVRAFDGSEDPSAGNVKDAQAREKPPSNRTEKDDRAVPENESENHEEDRKPAPETNPDRTNSQSPHSPSREEGEEDGEKDRDEAPSDDYDWERHKGETDNPHFQNVDSESVGDGRYEVTLETDFSGFHYDVLIYDADGERNAATGIPVSSGEEGKFKELTFPVEVSDLPEKGLVKIRLYKGSEEAVKILDERSD
ncbi:serine/threonine protein kinase [Melghirimyces profundicolus]|uniref:Serine/threonine-protein kinase PrkC n=1 Tax=Melghirimyces profundicolus TaxID=1242148 RepID=A0A2T6BWA5_9BACL|nr:serine/threonine protein kinase [Melghirimyces profundicolus]